MAPDRIAVRELALPSAPVNGYGSISWLPVLEQLEEVETFDQLHELQSSFDPVQTRRASESLIVSWFDYANSGGPSGWSTLAPRSLTWTSVPSPRYDYREPISSADVFLVLSIIDGQDRQVSREGVLTVVTDDDGSATVLARDSERSDG